MAQYHSDAARHWLYHRRSRNLYAPASGAAGEQPETAADDGRKAKQNLRVYQAVKQLRVGGERLEFLAAHQQSRNPEVAELLGFFTIKVGEIDLCLHENHLDMRNLKIK